MIYRSNLAAPDLTPYFRYTLSRPMGHSFGHDVLSDWADKKDDDPVFGLYKRCGFWTHDEAAILYQIAKQFGGDWLDIGSHTGWTMCHIAAAGRQVLGIDNMYAVEDFRVRAAENITACFRYRNDISLGAKTSGHFFTEQAGIRFAGVVIDGDHERPIPFEDAKGAERFLHQRGIILFHDAIGAPVQEGISYLVGRGFHIKIYLTPHVVACCWRGEYEPPEHNCDPNVRHGVWPYIQELLRMERIHA